MTALNWLSTTVHLLSLEIELLIIFIDEPYPLRNPTSIQLPPVPISTLTSESDYKVYIFTTLIILLIFILTIIIYLSMVKLHDSTSKIYWMQTVNFRLGKSGIYAGFQSRGVLAEPRGVLWNVGPSSSKLRGLGERCKLPAGYGAEPQPPTSDFGAF